LEVVVGAHLLLLGWDERDAGAGKDAEAEVAVPFDPFVVLLCEDGSDQTDQGCAVGAPLSSSGSDGRGVGRSVQVGDEGPIDDVGEVPF
jgi:hypothetical protein